MSRHSKFITTASMLYILFASSWIALSDRLLAQFVDIESLVWASTAKGALFVLITAAGLVLLLRATPAAAHRQREAFDAGTYAAFSQQGMARLPGYAFALLVTMLALLTRECLISGMSDRPMLIVFMLPITLSALLGGTGPGLCATALAGVGVLALPLPLWRQVGAASGYDWFQWFMLLVNGTLVSLLGALLRSASSRIESHRRLLDSVMSGTTDAVFIKDLAGRYVYVNPAASAMFGMPAEDIVGKDDHLLFPGHAVDTMRALDRAVAQDQATRTAEERMFPRAGRERVFLSTKGPVFDAAGAMCGTFGVARDITERKQVELRLQRSEERFQLAVEATSDGLWDWDLAGGQLFQTARACALTGQGACDRTGDLDGFLRPVHPDDLARVREHIAAQRLGATSAIDIDYRIVPDGGAPLWVRALGRVVARDAAGAPLRVVGTLSDITEHKRFEQDQREAATVFASSHDGIMMVSPQGLVTKVNPSFERITGYTAQEVVGQSPSKLASGRHAPAFYHEMWRTLAEHGQWRGEIWNRRKNGEVYAEQLSIAAVHDDLGKLQHYVAVFADISSAKEHEEELNKIANFDPLTGLPNRRLLSDRFAQAIARAQRTGSRMAVCFLDLDGFKAVNDGHGHGVGDRLLVHVAKQLTHVMRADDTLARVGGDEFILLLCDVGGPEDCSDVLDRVLAVVGEPVCIDGLELRVSASIGVSLYPDDNGDADSLLRHADQAMYLAKESGKNRYHMFDRENDRKAQQRRSVVERLRAAMLDGELVLYYQPKVDLRNGRVVGAEALIRWRHPEQGLLAPAAFMPQLMGSTLESEVGDWVIDTALAQLESWRAQGLHIPVSVNISADHLLQPAFAERLARALARHAGVNAADLELEVLETAAISDIEQAIAIMQRCRALGVHFSLDDFGTGYSSLTYLRRLPVDTLKIDQSFVRDMLVDNDDMGIVRGVIQLARTFHHAVIAEGVETLAHGLVLLELGCHLAQGYGIARPMAPENIGAWREEWMRAASWVALNAPPSCRALPVAEAANI